MRQLILFAAVLVGIGAFVARYADKAIVNPEHQPVISANSETMNTAPSGRNLASMPNSNSYPSSIPSPSQRPVVTQQPRPQAQPQQQLPQVVTLTRSVTLRDDGTGHFR